MRVLFGGIREWMCSLGDVELFLVLFLPSTG